MTQDLEECARRVANWMGWEIKENRYGQKLTNVDGGWWVGIEPTWTDRHLLAKVLQQVENEGLEHPYLRYLQDRIGYTRDGWELHTADPEDILIAISRTIEEVSENE